jgi:hypothetical protein
MSIVAHDSFDVLSRPSRVNALMWVAEHAGILADGYSVSIVAAYVGDEIMGDVSVQGQAGSLQSLVARLDAVRNLEKSGGYSEWVAIEDGVRIRLVEEGA